MTYGRGLGQVTVSEGFPSECLILHRDIGFQWLCGEPVPAGVGPLLRNSQVDNPVIDAVVPTEPYIPADPETAYTAEEWIEEPAPLEAGFGIWGLLASLLFGAALTRTLE